MNTNSTPSNDFQISIINVLFVGLLFFLWFLIFTLGSQFDHENQNNLFIRFITTMNPNIMILGCISSMLGVARR
jgi:hypothetical protein